MARFRVVPGAVVLLLAMSVLTAGSSCSGPIVIDIPGASNDPVPAAVPASTVRVRFVNSHPTLGVDVQFYATGNPVSDPATELFVGGFQRTNVGLFSRGVIPRLDHDELELPCAEARVIGTLGGLFLDSDTGAVAGTGTQRVLAQDVIFTCGDVIILEYLDDGGGLTTRVTVE